MKEYEILNKDDGYWIVDSDGFTQGPYDSIKDCHDDIPPEADVQYPLKVIIR